MPSAEKCQYMFGSFPPSPQREVFKPAQRLGGAHGRDYDYLSGHGELDRHLREAGWITSEAPKKNPNNMLFEKLSFWSPPEELHQQALAGIPRFVTQRCGTNDTDWASQQIGHHFSIGVAGTCKGSEDKPFAINLAGPIGPKTVMVNFFMDGRGDPYGTKTIGADFAPQRQREESRNGDALVIFMALWKWL